VATTLNQSLLRGKVVVMQDNQKMELEKGEHDLREVKWIVHDGVGYVFPKPSQIKLKNNPASGSWYAISQQSDSPKGEIKMDVFKLWFDHGSRPTDLTYEYIIVPSTTESAIVKNSPDRDIRILANSTDIQAVKHSRLNIFQAVFYNAGEIHFSENLKLICYSPGIVMVKTDGEKVTQISVSDPNRELDKLCLSISSRIEAGDENFKAVWNERKGYSDISFTLPQNELGGKSTTIELTE
jgi:chondroitin AC lyase